MMALMNVFISPILVAMLILLLVLLTKSTSIATNNNNNFSSSSSSSANSHVLCIQSEREALLKFKEEVTDPPNRLATWVGKGDCCKWAGVVCNKVTGHVQELHLRNPSGYYNSFLVGKINPSLFSLRNLRYLDLSNNKFSGMVPSQLGNLSGLHYLNLGSLYYQPLYVESLHWLSRLPLLQYLGLSNVDLSLVPDWLQVTNMLPSLVELHLSNCELSHFPSLPVVNFTNLLVLDLSSNLFDGAIPRGLQNMTSLRELDLSCNYLIYSTIPDWLYSFSHLEHLDLHFNSLQGSISSAVGNLTSVITLDLSHTNLEGKMPRSFGDLCSLREIRMSGVTLGENVTEVLDILSRCILDGLEILELYACRLSGNFADVIEQLGQYSNSLATLNLAYNSLYGFIPVSILKLSSIRILDLSENKLTRSLPHSLGQLASLEDFRIDQNSLQGVVSEVHFANLTRLKRFLANRNRLTFEVSPNWTPPFQIEELRLSCCQLGQQFPMWLQSQKNLVALDVSSAGISDTIPSWFWNLSSQFWYLNISHNHIRGGVDYIAATDEAVSIVDLGSNHLKGSLPDISSNVTELYLSNNSFSGSLSSFLCYRMDEEEKSLTMLDLEGNLLSGDIPGCWKHWPRLAFVSLGNNHLTGHVPSSMGFLSNLQSLHLRHNNLSGEFPLSLQNCTELLAIDLGENQFSEKIAPWIGERLSKLKILILQSNKFHGHIPVELCRLSSLQIMVFSHNNLSGTIPRCFNNISSMVNKQKSDAVITFHKSYVGFSDILDNAILVMKGKEAEYSTILLLVTLLDLSDNNLSGEIPNEMANLVGLLCLDLSKNRLTGRIPWEVGSMTSLEWIDLSMNQLSGEIPPSMSSLTFLSHLNLSNNNLTGRIPSSTQLQSLESSGFIGNKLCGPPLTKDCPASVVIPNVGNGEGKTSDGSQVEWFYVSLVFGFVVGFWGLIGPILFNKSWRFSYYQFLDRMWFKFCGIIRKCC